MSQDGVSDLNDQGLMVHLGRIMKHLAATNLVAETGTDSYQLTTTSRALVEPKYRDGICYK